MAGKIVHGSGLGVLDHYIDPMAVLESAASSVRLPLGFTFDDDERKRQAKHLPDLLQKMDPEARALILQTAQRLVE